MKQKVVQWHMIFSLFLDTQCNYLWPKKKKKNRTFYGRKFSKFEKKYIYIFYTFLRWKLWMLSTKKDILLSASNSLAKPVLSVEANTYNKYTQLIHLLYLVSFVPFQVSVKIWNRLYKGECLQSRFHKTNTVTYCFYYLTEFTMKFPTILLWKV